MTPLRTLAEPLAFEMAVFSLYLELPETPLRTSANDAAQARLWFHQGVSLTCVQTALLLGSLRRLTRSPLAPPLTPIRSLAYFRPVVDELSQAPVSDQYRLYLLSKIQPYLRSHPRPELSSFPASQPHG